MTEQSFADLVRLADRYYRAAELNGADFHREHAHLQAALASLPFGIRRVLVCTLIMENLSELIHGPRTGDGAAPCSITHQIGLACATCGWDGAT